MNSSGTFISDLKREMLKRDENFERILEELKTGDPDYYEALLNLRQAAINAIAVSIDPQKAKKKEYQAVVASVVIRYQRTMMAAL